MIRPMIPVLAIALVTAPLTGNGSADEPSQTIRLSLNPSIYNNLPIILAADKGYFAEQASERRDHRDQSIRGKR